MIPAIALSLWFGFMAGGLLARAADPDIDLKKENLKLRKENEVLWNKIRKISGP